MRFHHVGIAVESIANHATLFEKALGLTMTGVPVDDTGQHVRVAFISLGNAALAELVEPLDEQSPISSLLRRGGGLYHVCYEVDDLDATIKTAQAAGAILITPARRAPAFGERRIAFVHLTDGSIVEFLEAKAI
jgi:methylmalonyl-CoA/ethylmalonyl-CoA epimerase